jgi:hypothetical protein
MENEIQFIFYPGLKPTIVYDRIQKYTTDYDDRIPRSYTTIAYVAVRFNTIVVNDH